MKKKYGIIVFFLFTVIFAFLHESILQVLVTFCLSIRSCLFKFPVFRFFQFRPYSIYFCLSLISIVRLPCLHIAMELPRILIRLNRRRAYRGLCMHYLLFYGEKNDRKMHGITFTGQAIDRKKKFLYFYQYKCIFHYRFY